jgi:predicted dienelactone hydrolase
MKTMTLARAPIGAWKVVSLLVQFCFALTLMVGGVLPALAQHMPEQVGITLPEPTGPYSVGRTIYEWTDANRDEIYSDVDGEKRDLVVWMWYPAESANDTPPAAYMPGLLGDSFEQSLGLDTDQIHISAYADAPIAGTNERYPVLVFSHGSGSLLPVYSALLVELASHGYIVVGIQHPYNALITGFADGRVIAADPEVLSNESVQYWSEDTAFVIDQLEALNVESELIAGRLDLSRLGIFGHSFGGATAADFCLTDTRCVAGVNLDGSYSGAAADEGVTQPFMQVFSDTTCEEIVASGGMPSLEACQQILDQNRAGWQTMFEASAASFRVRIAGTRHGSFSDVPFLLPLLPQFADGATIDPERAWRITGDYALAFFNKYLNSEVVPLLDAPSPDYPEVTFDQRGN